MTPSAQALALLLLVHVAVWTLVPAATYQSVPKDTLEGIAWGQLWQLGYDKHPFLAPWVSAFFTNLFGTVGWPVFLVSQLCVALCFWAIWALARQMLDPRRAFASVLLLEGIHYYNLSSFTLNPNIVMLPTWALLTLTFYRAMRAPTLGRWILVGVCAGFAVLAKYESGVLFVVLGGLLAGTPQGRRSLATPGPYLGVLAAFIVAAPNLFWLTRHDFISIRYALGYLENAPVYQESHLGGPLMFLADQVASLIPAVLLWLTLSPGRLRFDRHNFDHQFILALTTGPLLVTTVVGFVAGVHLVPRWGFPFFNLFGVALLVLFRSEADVRRMTRLVGAASALSAMMVAGLLWVIYVRPYTTGQPPYSITFPTRPLANLITAEWYQRYGRPLPFVAGDRYLASGVVAYSTDRPIPYFDWEPASNPWTTEGQLEHSGAVFVHGLSPGESDAPFTEQLRTRFPALEGQRIVTLPQLSAAPLPRVRIWIAYLPPGHSASTVRDSASAAMAHQQ